MKKLKMIIVGLLLVITFFVGQSRCYAAKKINVYIFEGDGCPHCAEAIEWFEGTLAEDEEYKDLYKLVKYEVWYNEENADLMKEVASELGTEASGVPFIVIGDKYFSGFSAENTPGQIKTTIKEKYLDEEYQDVVKAVKNGTSIKKGESAPILPIIIISAITVVVVIALVFFTKEK